MELGSFVDELTDGDTGEPNDVPLAEDTNSVDVQVSWDDPVAVLTPGDIELRTKGGRRLARVSARTQRLALQRVGRSLSPPGTASA